MGHEIHTLPPDALARFLIRHRRGGTLERYEPRLDAFFGEILFRAIEFVPSQAGSILLDDPRAKRFDVASNRLTHVATYGLEAEKLLGGGIPLQEGLAGLVYTNGRSRRWQSNADDLEPAVSCGGLRPFSARSLLGVPIVMGTSICGVLQLFNRVGRDNFTDEDTKLIEIFAGYLSSSIQNTIDGMRARELARRDDLTGLFNDRYFFFRLRNEINRAEREGLDLCVIFLDLDNFKTINDRFGHLEGSRTLHDVGLLLEAEIPAGGVGARYGGDEFVVILPETPLEGALQVARRLHALIGGMQVGAAGRSGSSAGGLRLTASFGVVSLRDHLPPAGASPTVEQVPKADTLIRLADAAMYRAKALGRDRIVIVEEADLAVADAALRSAAGDS